jgi:hypothetical protein
MHPTSRRGIDAKIVYLFARSQQRGEPARLLAAASPSFGWLRRISEFWKNSWVRPTLAVAVRTDLLGLRLSVELPETIFERVLFGNYFCGKHSGDLFMKDPQLVNGHRFIVTSFHEGLFLKDF